uniref:F-box domain-containing protein n=1 Tax=Steinernema glaseri TaxID=37863 RepID=A0A1I7ZJ62_9BILA
MDFLPYDLVEEVVNYLPRADVETIARVAARSPELEAWNLASEYQLEKRFTLDVHVRIKQTEGGPRITMSVLKNRPNYSTGWNYTKWSYAWIREVTIEQTVPWEGQRAEVQMLQALRCVSLPVDPSVHASLTSASGVGVLECCSRYVDKYGAEETDLYWKMLRATQKEFVNVTVRAGNRDPRGAIEEFAADFIQRGHFLESLDCRILSRWQGTLFGAIAPLFGRVRGRPLKIDLGLFHQDPEEIQLCVDNWWKSDGIFEDIEVSYRVDIFENAEKDDRLCESIRNKYKTAVINRHRVVLAHPSRRSSLFIENERIEIMKFRPWHIPVDFAWMESLINRWDENVMFDIRFLTFQDEDDWLKLVEKYGPLKKEDVFRNETMKRTFLEIMNPLQNEERMSLQIEERDGEYNVQHRYLDCFY